MLRKCSNLVVLKNELTAQRFEQNGGLRCGLCLGDFYMFVKYTNIDTN